MNSNRTNFNFPSEHKIIISDYLLLSFIEGEGSFYLERKYLRAKFSIGLAQIQLPVIEIIREFFPSAALPPGLHSPPDPSNKVTFLLINILVCGVGGGAANLFVALNKFLVRKIDPFFL